MATVKAGNINTDFLFTTVGHTDRAEPEWILDPNKSGPTGKKSVFDGVYRGTLTSERFLTLEQRMGAKNKVYCSKRNGIGEASPGDKNYQVAEYSKGFHASGSTRPCAKFSEGVRNPDDTSIPLLDPTARKRMPARKVDALKAVEEEKQVVKQLDDWRPATPLQDIDKMLESFEAELNFIKETEEMDDPIFASWDVERMAAFKNAKKLAKKKPKPSRKKQSGGASSRANK